MRGPREGIVMKAISDSKDALRTVADTNPSETTALVRRLWSEAENLLLMHLWDVVKSQTLIAIMMRRSISSIQTQGSRLGLPPRSVARHKRRPPWSVEDDRNLDEAMRRLTNQDGKVPIVELSEAVRRSVEDIVARLEQRYGATSSQIDALVAPPPPTIPPVRPKTKSRFPGTIICLRSDCRRTFYSPGPWKRICNTCRRSDNDDALGF